MKKNEIIEYLNKNMVKVFTKLENTENSQILEYKESFLKLYNSNLSGLTKSQLNDIMVKFDSISNKIRMIEIKNR